MFLVLFYIFIGFQSNFYVFSVLPSQSKLIFGLRRIFLTDRSNPSQKKAFARRLFHEKVANEIIGPNTTWPSLSRTKWTIEMRKVSYAAHIRWYVMCVLAPKIFRRRNRKIYIEWRHFPPVGPPNSHPARQHNIHKIVLLCSVIWNWQSREEEEN